MYINYKGYEFEVYDSWKILMSSIGDLGESLGQEKLEIDYDFYNEYNHIDDVPKKAIEYLERDIDIAIKATTSAFKNYEKKMTRASMGYNDFMKSYGERNFANDFGGKVWDYKNNCWGWENMLTKREWKIVEKSYQGGYCSYNKKIVNKKIKVKNGVSYDLNSSYPASMQNNKMPYGKMLYSQPKGDYIKLISIHIIKAELKDKNNPALIKDKKSKYRDAKYLDVCEHEERVYWNEEWNYIKKYYNVNYRLIATYYFKTKYVFREWINEKQHLKINAPNKIEKDFHKGILNSVYGKYGQKFKIGSRVIIKDGLEIGNINGEKYLLYPDKKVYKSKDKYYYKIKDEYIKIVKLNNKIRYGEKGEYRHIAKFMENDKLKYVPISSYITWLSRKLLWDGIFNNLSIWLYSDTDSCYYSDHPSNLDIHQKRLGAWKGEYKFDEFKVLRAKTYMYNATHESKDGQWIKNDSVIKKIAGVSKKGKKHVNWDNFYLGSVIKNAKSGVINVDDGKLIITKDYQIGKLPDGKDPITREVI